MASRSGLRRKASRTLAVLTFLLAIVSGPIWYAGEIVRDEDRFVAVTDQVLSHPDVRQAVAEEVTAFTLEALETDEAVADLLPGQTRALAVPISRLASQAITGAAFEILDTEVAVRARDAALREVHGQLTADEEEVIIDLRPVLVRTARELAGPTAGSAVTQFLAKSDEGRFVVAERDSPAAAAISSVRSVQSLGLIAGIITLVALVLTVAVAPDRRRALVRAGAALALGTAVSVVLMAVLLRSTTLLTESSLGPSVGRGVAESLATDFGQRQRGGVVGGALIAVVGLLLGGRPSATALRSLPRLVWRRDSRGVATAVSATVLDNPALARLVCWLAPALLLLVWPLPTGRVVVAVLLVTAALQVGIWLVSSRHRTATAARSRFALPDPPSEIADVAEATQFTRVNTGVAIALLFLLWPGWSLAVVRAFFLVIAGIQALLDVVAARRLVALNEVAERVPSSAPTVRARRGYVAAGLAVTAIIVGIVGTTLLGDDVAEAQTGCNGHVELCDRSIDEIVWAGSHNSMSSDDLGWELAAQTGDIVAQLDHGIRALLIDTHYWDGEGTFEGGTETEAAAIIEAAVENDRPRVGTWLCHGPCALGATDLVSALTAVGLWLDENPREVLIVIVQDEISTADTFEAFEASSLIGRVHHHRSGTPFPTLSELIELDERLLVYAENEGSPDSWYQNAWEATFVDTPFSFSVRSDFACSTNRGTDDNPLFLVNHWLTTGVPLRDTAAVVNSRSTLLERVEQCRQEWDRLPNVIAVDFAETGDLVDVVAELNDVGS